MKVLEEKAILPHDVMETLKSSSKKPNLSYIEERTLSYLKKTLELPKDDARSLLIELENELGNILPKTTLIKIVEFLPRSIEDLKIVLYGLSIDREYMEKIISIVSKYK